MKIGASRWIHVNPAPCALSELLSLRVESGEVMTITIIHQQDPGVRRQEAMDSRELGIRREEVIHRVEELGMVFRQRHHKQTSPVTTITDLNRDRRVEGSGEIGKDQQDHHHHLSSVV